jgi:predicted Ser/Thr protein kinase
MGKHFPQFELLELLGQGGMGFVYKAKQRSLDRLVALKVLPPESAREAGFAERFSREARTLARLQHPNIVGVHDFGAADGLYYLVMEFVDGANLRQAMRAGRLSPREALAVVPQVCDALQYAHDQGVVHRDIKPENILLDRAGRVRIADFGLAKIVLRSPVDLTITRAGQVMGTLHYMAPEQYRAPDSVDHRADIFSLGVVFYEMLTGELPLGSFPPPSEKAGVDARLDGVVLRALERERDRRWQHASDMKTRVSSIAGGEAAGAGAGEKVAAAAASAAAASAAAKPPVPAGPPPVLDRWAFWGGLGVPLSLAAGLLAWLLMLPLASGHAAVWTGWAAMFATAFAGWVASIAGWVRIHHDRAHRSGLGWAVTGTFLPLVLFCAGGFTVPLFLLAAAPGEPRVRIHDGPGGVRVEVPGVVVEDGPGGTRVKVAGIEIEDVPKMARLVTGGPPGMRDRDRAVVAGQMWALWNGDGQRFLEEVVRFQGAEAREFRLFAIALEADGRTGRLVVSGDKGVIAAGVSRDAHGVWVLSKDGAESRDDPAREDDRDGRLHR